MNSAITLYFHIEANYLHFLVRKYAAQSELMPLKTPNNNLMRPDLKEEFVSARLFKR
jgi:hypothetical protein